MESLYNKSFYANQAPGSVKSARIILPVLFNTYKPRSVIDIGCGVGAWLYACRELGVSEYLGIDGDYMKSEDLMIEPDKFRAMNLEELQIEEAKYDLLISVEVAEHIAPGRVDGYIGTITRLSDVILFSAAIPYQGGTGHVNENWPEYWVSLFLERGFRVYDFIRPAVWNHPDVDFWYRQNMLVFCSESKRHVFEKQPATGAGMPLSVVHPEMYLNACHRGRGKIRNDYWTDRQYYIASSTTEKESNQKPNLCYGREFNILYSDNWLLRLIKTIKK
jgi:hypothetical protein